MQQDGLLFVGKFMKHSASSLVCLSGSLSVLFLQGVWALEGFNFLLTMCVALMIFNVVLPLWNYFEKVISVFIGSLQCIKEEKHNLQKEL